MFWVQDQIEGDGYLIVQNMGQGSYGVTFKVIHNVTQKLYIFKVVQVNQKSWMTGMKNEEEIKNIEDEFTKMKALDYCRVA